MKKLIAIILVFALAFSASAYAATSTTTSTTENGPMTKLGRGLLNIIDAITEIPGTMMRESQAEGAATGQPSEL